MDQVKDGGPAFPCGLQSGHLEPKHGGMTLRDYFAAKAVAGLMTRVWNQDGKLTGEQIIEQWAATAYAVADAMLKAREKTNE